MESLNKSYADHLEQLKQAVIHSEQLAAYLDSESDEDYKLLCETFEPHIQELYDHIANQSPLQLVALEQELLDESFEGLFLPRILGFSVLRPEIDTNTKYKRPQEHFKRILMTICDSANFDLIKQRIGQTVQVGFALSSDIWLTNLMNQITNKKIKTFLQAQQTDKWRDAESRKSGYHSYARQFKNYNFQSADFPDNMADFKVGVSALIDFLIYRISGKFDNSSLIPHLTKMLGKEDFYKEDAFVDVLMITGLFYPLEGKDQKLFTSVLDMLRKQDATFTTNYFNKLIKLYQNNVEISPETEKRISALINKSIDDELSKYYKLMDTVHAKGYIHEDAINAVRNYYESHKGLSAENECLRDSIFGYFKTFLSNLDEQSYHEYFEINKIFVSYIHTFSNQKFNQYVKDLSIIYINRLLDFYSDRRSKDYQDIKKFVTTTFLDLGFKSEKELAELFKVKK